MLQGQYEHIEIAEVRGSNRDQLELKGTRTFPPARIAKECPASKALHSVPGGKQPVTTYIAVPDPKMMSIAGMGVTGNPKVTFSADKQSFITKLDDGWTLTFTPVIVR